MANNVKRARYGDFSLDPRGTDYSSPRGPIPGRYPPSETYYPGKRPPLEREEFEFGGRPPFVPGRHREGYHWIEVPGSVLGYDEGENALRWGGRGPSVPLENKWIEVPDSIIGFNWEENELRYGGYQPPPATTPAATGGIPGMLPGGIPGGGRANIPYNQEQRQRQIYSFRDRTQPPAMAQPSAPQYPIKETRREGRPSFASRLYGRVKKQNYL